MRLIGVEFYHSISNHFQLKKASPQQKIFQSWVEGAVVKTNIEKLGGVIDLDSVVVEDTICSIKI